MIKVFIPTDREFNYQDCKKMYEKYQRLVGDNQKFDDVVKGTFFYSFFDDLTHLGCIYYYIKDGKLFVNAFANRHTHLKNIECLKQTFEWFKGNIYAETRHKTAIFCLYKCGFKKSRNNIYVLERK